MRLAEKPKTYVVVVTYKGAWPYYHPISYHYINLQSALAHVTWLARQIRAQNGHDADRKNVVTGFSLEELLFSKARNKKFPPLYYFSGPDGRESPKGGFDGFFEKGK